MPPYMNPVNDFYFRQSQSQFNFPPNTPQVNCRFVTNREEAKASMIDGFSYNLFLDSSNGKIYLKKLNNNGVSDFITYTIDEEKQADPINEINTRLSRIEQIVGGKYESISNDVGYVKSEPVSHTTVTEQNERYDETKSAGFPKDAGNDKWQKRR